MKVVFLPSDKERENTVADAFLEGVESCGDEAIKEPKSGVINPDLGDVFCMIGVKSRKLFAQARKAGKHVIFFDKGYFRHRGPSRTWEYWRVCVNDHHPTDYVGKATHGPARWDQISKRRMIEVKPWRDAGDHIVYAGSSEKYHEFARLPHPTQYAQDVISELKKLTDRKIIYRPKPTWYEAEPVNGAAFSGRTESIVDVLRACHALVTNGSNASFDAMLLGVPSVVLGNAIARPISSTELRDVEKPRLASEEERMQWLYNIAWCMFTEPEMEMGIPWQALRPQLFGECLDDSEVKVVAGSGMKPSKALLKKSGQWKKTWKKRHQKHTGKP